MNKNSATAEIGDRLVTIDMGQKVWGLLCRFFGRRCWSPSNTMSPGPRPTSLPSGNLIHPFGHNKQTSQTDRQTTSDSIAKTDMLLRGFAGVKMQLAVGLWSKTLRYCRRTILKMHRKLTNGGVLSKLQRRGARYRVGMRESGLYM